MDLELVSFKLCPFVQRSKITLLRKGVEHRTTYIDLADPPAWFKKRSPLGLVPVLTVGGTTLFESAVINEYLDEVTGGDLMPADPLAKAQARAWVEYASACNMDFARMTWSTTQEEADGHRDALRAKLARLEQTLGDGPWFLGDAFSLVDTSFAPVLMRAAYMDETRGAVGLEAFPKLAAWANRLTALPEVQQSLVPEWRDLLEQYLRDKGSFLARPTPAA